DKGAPRISLGIRIFVITSSLDIRHFSFSRESVLCLRFSYQRCVDCRANTIWGFVSSLHWLVVDVQRWSHRYSEGFAARMIGIDSFFGLFAVDVLFELIKIEP